jgi:hypothetical protein
MVRYPSLYSGSSKNVIFDTKYDKYLKKYEQTLQT